MPRDTLSSCRDEDWDNGRVPSEGLALKMQNCVCIVVILITRITGCKIILKKYWKFLDNSFLIHLDWLAAYQSNKSL